ncbi:protein HGV2 isoform X2 [Periplaneta americana]
MEPEAKSDNPEQETSNKEEAFTHLAQGKRHLLVKDYNEAVTSLASACQLLSQLYGEAANECGEAYFNYGIALLELGRTENGVLGIEGEGNESQDSDDGEDEVEDEKEENTTSSEEKQVENGKHDEEPEKKGSADTDTESKKDETNGTNNDEAGTNDKSKEESDEDDVSNLRLAWEMLELAKIIFQRQAEGSKQMNLKLAEVHLKLGEVGLESETYTQAIEDIKMCLQIQTDHLDEHDRCIAETHYQLGMAYSLVHDFDEAIEQLNQAHQLLEKRIKYLQERGKQGVTSAEQNENNPFYTIEGEISEINALLPEIKEKISDLEDFKKEAKKALLAKFDVGETGIKSETGQGSSAESSGAFPVSSRPDVDSKPVSNISHLVRKKR